MLHNHDVGPVMDLRNV